MKKLVLALVALMANLQTGSSVPISTYELVGNGDVKSNLVEENYENIEGLYPPKPIAKNYFNLESDKPKVEVISPYTVEITRYYLKFPTEQYPTQDVKLLKEETEGIQKLTLAFVKLLNQSKFSSQDEPENESNTPDWKNLNPVITLSHSGITIRFLDEPESDSKPTEEQPEETRYILWDFLTKYTSNIFEEKLKMLNTSDVDVVSIEFPVKNHGGSSEAFQRFINSLWKIMAMSVEYAESAFDGWTTPETTTPEAEEKTRSTIATLFAYEEPFPVHVFPAEEFEKRRRDIDSIFYGRGII